MKIKSRKITKILRNNPLRYFLHRASPRLLKSFKLRTISGKEPIPAIETAATPNAEPNHIFFVLADTYHYCCQAVDQAPLQRPGFKNEEKNTSRFLSTGMNEKNSGLPLLQTSHGEMHLKKKQNKIYLRIPFKDQIYNIK